MKCKISHIFAVILEPYRLGIGCKFLRRHSLVFGTVKPFDNESKDDTTLYELLLHRSTPQKTS